MVSHSTVLLLLVLITLSPISLGGVKSSRSTSKTEIAEKPKILSSLEEAYQNRERIAVADSTGALPIHLAFYDKKWELLVEYAKLWPKSLLIPFPYLNANIIDWLGYEIRVSGKEAYKVDLLLTLLQICPEAGQMSQEGISALSYFTKKNVIFNDKTNPKLKEFFRASIAPRVRKDSSSPGGALEVMMFMLHQLQLHRIPTFRTDLQSRWRAIFNYIVAIDILSEKFPDALSSDQWNPKFLLVLFETYLHIISHYDDINFIINRMSEVRSYDASYQLMTKKDGHDILLTHLNSFMIRLLLSIEKNTNSVAATEFTKPNILHAIEWQIIKTNRNAMDFNDGYESTKPWDKMNHHISNLKTQLIQTEAFKELASEFGRRKALNQETFERDIEKLSAEYIQGLADYKIDYRSAKE